MVAEPAELDRGVGADARRRAGEDRGAPAHAPQLQRQRREAAHADRVHARDPARLDPVVREAPPELLEHDPALEPRERRAQAEVRALAEGDARVGVAAQVVGVGVREGALVAVGRAEQQHHPLPGGDLDTVQRHRPVRDPHDPLARVVVAQRLLDPARDQARVVGEELALVGIAPQPVQRVGEQLRRGLVARDDHQVAEGLHLHRREPHAVDLGGEQRADQVALRRALPLLDERAEVLPDLPERDPRGGRHVEHAFLAVHEQVGLLAQLGAVGRGHAHQLGDHVHRQDAREVADELAATALAHALEMADRHLADARLELRDPPRREAARDERPHLRVARRVHAEERHHELRGGVRGRRLDRDAVGVGVEVGVLDRGEHVGVPRERVEVEGRVVVDRRLFAQPRVDRVRVLVDLVGERVVLELAHDPASGGSSWKSATLLTRTALAIGASARGSAAGSISIRQANTGLCPGARHGRRVDRRAARARVHAGDHGIERGPLGVAKQREPAVGLAVRERLALVDPEQPAGGRLERGAAAHVLVRAARDRPAASSGSPPCRRRRFPAPAARAAGRRARAPPTARAAARARPPRRSARAARRRRRA